MIDTAAALRELAEPRSPDEFIKTAIERAAKLVLLPNGRMPYWRAFDIWYGKARQIRDFEVAAVFSALEKKQREAARNELSELRTRLTRLESLLAQSDPDFHRPQIDQVRGQLRQMGGTGRPVDRSGNRG